MPNSKLSQTYPLSRYHFYIWLLFGFILYIFYFASLKFIDHNSHSNFWSDLHLPAIFSGLLFYILLGFTLQLHRDNKISGSVGIIFGILIAVVFLTTSFFAIVGDIMIRGSSFLYFKLLYFFYIDLLPVNLYLLTLLILLKRNGNRLESSAFHLIKKTTSLMIIVYILTFFILLEDSVPVERLRWFPEQASNLLLPIRIHKLLFPLDLYELVKMKRLKELRKRLEEGANPNEVHVIPPYYTGFSNNCHDGQCDNYYNKENPKCDELHLAAANGQLEMVILLVRFGADPKIRHFCNGVNLYWLGAGRQIKYFDLGGYNAVDESVRYKQTQVLKWFQKNGFKPTE
ncbi:MAG: hypothetical protein AAF518_25255 [Spirochaetota bacterium]